MSICEWQKKQRKNEILDTAKQLFSAKGFDNTSTTNILNVIGVPL